MPRRRRGGSSGYLVVAIVLILILLVVTGVIRIQISPQVQVPSSVNVPLPDLSSAIATVAPGIVVTTPANPAAAPPAAIGQRSKNSGCAAHNALPDSACTPGAIIPNATKDQICTPGYSSSVRDVPTSEKDQVYGEYGITQHSAGEYEVDHLISLELGGSNDIANLWPEAASPKPGFHEKDKVENYLHDQVCNGAVSLQDAQRQIATNWLSIYQSMPSK